METENLHTKLVEKLVEKKFEYWKELFIERLKDLIPDEIEDECPHCKTKFTISPVMEKEEIDKLASSKLKYGNE